MSKAQPASASVRRRRLVSRAAAIGAVLVVVGGLFAIYRTSAVDSGAAGTEASGGTGKYIYQVGRPGPGDQAPPFSLPSTQGGTVSSSHFAGRTVLTYWHEGLGCQPCWDQIRSLEANRPALKAAGIDEVVSITSGPVDALKQKMGDDKLALVTLADTDLAVSKKYQMNQFGMMGDSRDGHSFLLIGPDGKILWRADYGGAPNYTMYVPVDRLLAQLKTGRR
ncbi:peroxiredoxin family protein [Nocardioides korecus]